MTAVVDVALQDAAARVAVLPFESLSDGAGDAYFARGFVEDLIVELARFPTLEVLHPDSSLVPAAARAALDGAGVSHYLRGSVRRTADAVRVTAQLVDASTGHSCWAERFDAAAGEILALQDEIVARVASTAAIEIDSARLTRARRKALASLEVYDCWLRGLEALHGGTAADDTRARTFFERALEIDPSYARAHAGLSLSHFNEWSCQAWEIWDEKERFAYEHAARAVALDDADAQVQIVLGRVLLYRRDFAQAERHVVRALELNPSDADVLAQEVLARAGVDLLCAYTMTSVAESIGIVLAASEAGLPIVVSPTVETDGTLPDGTPLGELVRRVDDATGGAALLYMVNCAHPTHLAPTLARARAEGAGWLQRFGGLRANASRKSHAELDDSSELDRGDPQEVGREVAELQRAYGLRIVGGCCGTDAEHVAAIARAAGGAATAPPLARAG